MIRPDGGHVVEGSFSQRMNSEYWGTSAKLASFGTRTLLGVAPENKCPFSRFKCFVCASLVRRADPETSFRDALGLGECAH